MEYTVCGYNRFWANSRQIRKRKFPHQIARHIFSFSITLSVGFLHNGNHNLVLLSPAYYSLA